MSLRREKKSNLLALKRARNQKNLTKAKFFLYHTSQSEGSEQGLSPPKQSQHEFKLKKKEVLVDMLTAVNKSLRFDFGHPNSFSPDDLIQIICELKHITQTGGHHVEELELIARHDATWRILLTILAKDYDKEQVEVGKLATLLGHTADTLSNLTLDGHVMRAILAEYKIFSVLGTLIDRYILHDFFTSGSTD